jgi:hypothetical protein
MMSTTCCHNCCCCCLQAINEDGVAGVVHELLRDHMLNLPQLLLLLLLPSGHQRGRCCCGDARGGARGAGQ